jgi:EAL and modified HD-GYP domain-containing signal transduction protein
VESFVARQPIFDRHRHIYGYELLYRSGASSTKFDGTEAESATKQVIASTLLAIGLENVLGGKKAFLNFDEALLMDGIYQSLPRETTVIEILETVDPTADLVSLCRNIRAEGYTIALDDFVSSPQFEPLTKLAELIKVDLRLTSKPEQERMLELYQSRGIAMLAEKVETYEEFEWAKSVGYDYFQGYFFARPSVMRAHQLPSSKLNCLLLLTEMQQADLDFKRLEDLIRGDVALTYKLLRYSNSALFGRSEEIVSIQKALLVVGTDKIRHWVALATLSILATDKPGELATLSIIRARFCELLIRMAGIKLPDEAFLMGMFSLLDALLDCPLEEALRSVGLGPSITQVLLGMAREGDQLDKIYRLARRYEMGDWDEVETLATSCGLDPFTVGDAYVEAAAWANGMLRAVNSTA